MGYGDAVWQGIYCSSWWGRTSIQDCFQASMSINTLAAMYSQTNASPASGLEIYGQPYRAPGRLNIEHFIRKIARMVLASCCSYPVFHPTTRP